MKVYVASSWRNQRQPEVVERLRAEGHEVYDFRHPTGPDSSGFAWSDIDPNWQRWTGQELADALQTPIAKSGFNNDIAALSAATATVLVMPCGRSAHLELGFAVGDGQRTVILLTDSQEPELMYRMVSHICTTLDGVVEVLA